MNAPAHTPQLSADTLYDLAEAKKLWPEERRIIYCGITGRPWGVVSDDYVKFFIKNFGLGATPEKMNTVIDRMTIFAGPSPMWQTKSPDMLVINQHADPEGFLVYLLNWSLQLEAAAREATKSDVETYRNWRLSMIDLYTALQKIDKDFIHKVNDTILIMTGEGLYPKPHLFPSRELGPYGDRATLERLMNICHKYYNRYKGRGYSVAGRDARRERNEVHRRTFVKAYSAEDMDTKQQHDLVQMMLVDLFRDMDTRAGKDANRAAKNATGIGSATFAILKEIEEAQKLAVQKPVAKMYSAGQKLKFNFGKKKD